MARSLEDGTLLGGLGILLALLEATLGATSRRSPTLGAAAGLLGGRKRISEETLLGVLLGIDAALLGGRGSCLNLVTLMGGLMRLLGGLLGLLKVVALCGGSSDVATMSEIWHGVNVSRFCFRKRLRIFFSFM